MTTLSKPAALAIIYLQPTFTLQQKTNKFKHSFLAQKTKDCLFVILSPPAIQLSETVTNVPFRSSEIRAFNCNEQN